MPSPGKSGGKSTLPLPASEGQENHSPSGTLVTPSISGNTTTPSHREGEGETLPVIYAMCVRMSIICLALRTFLILRVQQLIKCIPEPLASRGDLLLIVILRNLDLSRKLDLHGKNLFLPAPQVSDGVVASSFLAQISEDRALTLRLNMGPGLKFGFWDLILGVHIMQSPRGPQQSLILKRKWLP